MFVFLRESVEASYVGSRKRKKMNHLWHGNTHISTMNIQHTYVDVSSQLRWSPSISYTMQCKIYLISNVRSALVSKKLCVCVTPCYSAIKGRHNCRFIRMNHSLAIVTFNSMEFSGKYLMTLLFSTQSFLFSVFDLHWAFWVNSSPLTWYPYLKSLESAAPINFNSCSVPSNLQFILSEALELKTKDR